MKNYIINSKGSILVSCFIIGMLILMLGMSSITIAMNDFNNTFSNSDSLKAYYLAEMGIEAELRILTEAIDDIVLEYLEDLKDAKIAYLRSNMEETLAEGEYTPLQLDTYLQDHLIDVLETFNTIQNNIFEDYKQDHSYKISVEYDTESEVVIIKSVGIFNNARKQIMMDIKLPCTTIDGYDFYGLPKLKIHPIEILSYYQTNITN